MPVYSVNIGPDARRDLDRLMAAAPQNQDELDRCARALMAVLRYDPALQGVGSGTFPNLRALACGPLRIFYRVSPPQDRFAVVVGFGSNTDWVW